MRAGGFLSFVVLATTVYFILDGNVSAAVDSKLSCPKPVGRWDKEETKCLIVQELLNKVLVYKKKDWGKQSAPLLEAGYVQGTKGFKVYKKGSTIPGCVTRSGLAKQELPKWLESEDVEEVEELLRTHCFLKQRYMDGSTFPFYVLYRVEPTPRGLRYASAGYVLPDTVNYVIIENMQALEHVCTDCEVVASGGYAHQGLIRSRSFTQLIQELRKN